jgi:methylenetetrahydrofolate dehydrogenase (NADP+) / methenyltetrahydrofolate cyclohydrolase
MGITPGLAVVLVGNDPASRTYVTNKEKDCASVGIYSEEYALPETTTQKELLELVQTLNSKKNDKRYLVQLPLPAGLMRKKSLRHQPVEGCRCISP